jgi:hypothetical protein
MSHASQIKEHMDILSSDRKMVGAWIDHVDQHVHLNKTRAEVTTHWQHEGRG